MSTTLLIALSVAAAAGLMRGFAGVGSGMLMAPFFVRLFGPIDTVAIIILLEIIVTAQLLPTVWREIRWPLVAPMGVGAAVFMPVGSWLLVNIDPEHVATVIAVLVIVFSLILMTGWRHSGSKPLPATLAVGATSGILMALTSLGNPPVMLYLLSSSDDAATNRANFTGYFALTLLALIALMTFTGMIKWAAVTTVAVLMPVFMISAWIGSRLFRQSNEALYRRVALTILLAAGLYGLLR